METHIAKLTNKGSLPLCGQPLAGSCLVGDALGDDLNDATCKQCLGLQKKNDTEAES